MRRETGDEKACQVETHLALEASARAWSVVAGEGKPRAVGEQPRGAAEGPGMLGSCGGHGAAIASRAIPLHP
jgi:hypothetical protein